MNLGAALTASFLVTLVRPATWPLALASFLLRGGIVIVLGPVIAIPSAIGFGNALAPGITAIVFGRLSTVEVALAAGVALGCLVILVVGALVAAAAEAELTTIVADDEEVVAIAGRRADVGVPAVGGASGVAGRILAVRLIAFLPLGFALVWGSVRIVAVAYRELTVPSDTATPIAVRVLAGAPEVVALLLVTWLLGQAIGAMGARQVVLGGVSVRSALAGGVWRLLRHPGRVIVLQVLPLGALVLVLVPSAAAAVTVWDAVRASLSTGGSAIASLGLVMLFVGLWLGGLLLAAVVSAWRAAAWTVDAAGTFGAIRSGREGDWNPHPSSATLHDPRPRGMDDGHEVTDGAADRLR
jgi:hypothetical protein